jgi:dTDP-4-dehydrorhamnose 3,5-epimerase
MDKIKIEILSEPTLIEGKKFVDDRGSLSFMNNVSLNQFERFYIMQNHRLGFVRAWHGHLKESKLFIPIEGAFKVGVARIDREGAPDKEFKPVSFVLDSCNSNGLYIPAGFANGSKSLTPGAKLLILSTTTLDQSKGDDFRFKFDQWDIWEEDFR